VTAYRWRDSARLSPSRIADLAAKDRRRAALERDGPDGKREAGIRTLAAYRAAGLSVAQAADLMGIARSTGRGYDRARRRRQ
jgi:hypothetical protein